MTKCPRCQRKKSICVLQDEGKRQVDKELPKDQKCGRCLKMRIRCFGTPPFTTKCYRCEELGRRCLPQGEEQRRVDGELPKEQRCDPCFQERRRCFGTPPFNTGCRTCIKFGRTCKLRDTEMDREGQPMENIDKCSRCASNNAKCEGGIPCSVCIKRGYNCSLEKTKCRLPRDQCCNSCNERDNRCNGERPCIVCRKANKECRWTEGKETWVYRPDPSKWPTPTRADFCAQCQKRAPLYFGGPPMQCNGELPCNCCLQQAFGKVRNTCTHHIGNGISKRYRLDDDKVAKARKSREEARYEKRKRLARTKSTDDSTEKGYIKDGSIPFQDNQKANSHDDDNMEQEGTDGRSLDDNFDLYLPEGPEQAGETDHDRSSEGGADDTDHEDFLHDSNQSPMEIDSGDGASQIGQRQVRRILGEANDVNDSLDQFGRPQELRSIPTNRKSSAKTTILDGSRPTTLLKKNRNIRHANANARASTNVIALTRRTSTRNRPWKIAKHA